MNSLYDGYREHEYTELREKYEPGYKQRNDGLNYGVKYIDQIEEFLAPHLVFPVRIFDWGGHWKEYTIQDKQQTSSYL